MTVERAPDGLIIKLDGELDVTACGEFELKVTALSLVNAKRVIFDLSGLTYISSMALGAIVAIRNDVLSGGGRVFLVGMSPLVLDCFRRPRLTSLFEVQDSVALCLPSE
jgi:anti-anti-sigma factor